MGWMKLIFGVSALAVSMYLFALNVWGQRGIYLAIAVSTLILAFLNGRKMAAIVHDSHVLKKRTKNKFSIAGAMAIPALFFMIMVLLMTLMNMVFFRTAGLIVSVAGSGITSFLYSILALLAFYLLFSHMYESHPDELKSSWGKRIDRASGMEEKMMGMAKGMAGKAMGPMGGMMR